MLFQLWTFSCWARVRGQLGLRTGWVRGRGSGSQALLGCSSHFWESQQNVDWQKQILQTQGKYVMHLHISFSIWTDFNNKEVQFGSILTLKRLDLGLANSSFEKSNWWHMMKLHADVWIHYVGFIQVGELNIGSFKAVGFDLEINHFWRNFQVPGTPKCKDNGEVFVGKINNFLGARFWDIPKCDGFLQYLNTRTESKTVPFWRRFGIYRMLLF